MSKFGLTAKVLLEIVESYVDLVLIGWYEATLRNRLRVKGILANRVDLVGDVRLNLVLLC
jgi:hypothetical protein